MLKSDAEQCGSLVAACLGLVLLLAATLQPFMPSFSSKVCATQLRDDTQTQLDLRRPKPCAWAADWSSHCCMLCPPCAAPAVTHRPRLAVLDTLLLLMCRCSSI